MSDSGHRGRPRAGAQRCRIPPAVAGRRISSGCWKRSTQCARRSDNRSRTRRVRSAKASISPSSSPTGCRRNCRNRGPQRGLTQARSAPAGLSLPFRPNPPITRAFRRSWLGAERTAVLSRRMKRGQGRLARRPVFPPSEHSSLSRRARGARRQDRGHGRNKGKAFHAALRTRLSRAPGSVSAQQVEELTAQALRRHRPRPAARSPRPNIGASSPSPTASARTARRT